MDPLSNMGQGATLDTTPQSPLSQEQMRTNLDNIFSKAGQKYQAFKGGEATPEGAMTAPALDGPMETAPVSDDLQKVFAFFEENGVDLNSEEAVRAFMDKLKVEQPDVFKEIETILLAAQGGGAPGEVPPAADMNMGGMPPTNMNMNPNENVQQNS